MPTDTSIRPERTGTDSGAARVLGAAQAFLAAVCGFEAHDALPEDCLAVSEAAAKVEKAAGALRFVAGARAVEAGAHKASGVADPTRWLARQGGTTGRHARGGLELARSLDAHPKTKEALLSGAVSIAQAQEIAATDEACPGHEHDLVALATRGDLSQLRDGARDLRLASSPVGDLHRRQLAARRFRSWRDGLGMVCFEGALPPQSGLPFVRRIEAHASRLRRNRSGHKERFETAAADALVALFSAGPSGDGAGAQRSDLVIVCDLSAWRRGHAHEGEPCQIVGGGPIPVPVAKELAADAFVKAVLHDGVAIHTVRHFGRHLGAELKTALDLGPVPTFSGRACTDCGRREVRLEYDHVDPVANHGPTAFENLKPRCYLCHQEKTERDRLAGRLGRAAARRTGPPGRDPP